MIRSIRHLPALGVAVTLAAITGLGATASEPDDRDEPASLAVSAEIASRGGKAARRLEKEDLTVEVGGEPVAVLDLVPLGAAAEPARIALYFDYSLSRPGPVQRVADRLREHAESLVALGAVEVIVADPEARTLLPPTQDVGFLRQALDRIFVSAEATDALGERRRTFLASVAAGADAGEAAQAALHDELLMLRSQQDELIRFLSHRRDRGDGPALLLIVDEGLAADPMDFYAGRGGAGAPTLPAGRLPTIREVTDTANAYRWSVFPLSFLTDGDDPALRYDPSVETPVGFRLRLGARGRDHTGTTDDNPFRPVPERWQALAAATGGRAASTEKELEGLFDRLAARYLVRFAAPPSTAASALRLAVADRSLEIRAPDSAPGATPEAISEVRVRRALAELLDDDSELEIAARIRLPGEIAGATAARLETEVQRVDVEGEAVAPPSRFRITLGVHTQNDEIIPRHELWLLQPGEPGEPAESAPWRHDSDLVLPPSTDSAVVVVENLDTGQWGIADVDFGAPSDVATGSRPGRLAADRPLSLLPVDGQLQRGKVWFRTVVHPEVDRVDFLVNGRRAARRNRSPFDAEIDLGTAGRTMQLVAVAYDRAGNEIDRDRLVINEPAESFWVRIVEPEPGGRHVGPTDVEARLKVPQSGAVDRVDFYWKERLLATAIEPPYRRRILIPVGDPEGFLRVQATLTDGRATEDVLVLNRAGFGEQIGVELVELYVVANDRDGKPVLGLSEADFQVFEDKSLQQIESFAVAGNLPLSLGLAIDSSSSLFLRMPAVKRAAESFVDSLERSRDRAFLVGFGSEPRLVRSTTSDFESLKTGVRALKPYGSTAVWGALTMALEQLDGITGRKALVVFYDGDDEDESFFENSLKLARRSRVPIYMILVNNEAARTQGRSLSSRAFVSKLDRISRAGGGRVFYVSTTDDLEAIFAQISAELRSHYLITYYPILEPGGPLWRPVAVEIDRRGVTARTIEGRGVTW